MFEFSFDYDYKYRPLVLFPETVGIIFKIVFMGKKELINARFTELNLTQIAAAKMLETTPQQMNAYVCGRKNFGKDTALKWSNTFGFNPNWLMYEDGPVLKDQSGGISINTVTNRIDHIIKNSTVGEKASEALKIENAQLSEKVKHLEMIIAEKDERITEKERLIQVLMKDNH